MWLFAAITVRFRPVPMTSYRILMGLYHSDRSMNGGFYLGYIGYSLTSCYIHGSVMVYENCPMNGKKDQTADWRLAEFVSYLSIWSVGDRYSRQPKASPTNPGNDSPKTNMTMENPPFEDVCFLLKMGIFQFHVNFHGCIGLFIQVYFRKFLKSHPRCTFQARLFRHAGGYFWVVLLRWHGSIRMMILKSSL